MSLDIIDMLWMQGVLDDTTALLLKAWPEIAAVAILILLTVLWVGELIYDKISGYIRRFRKRRVE